MNASNLTCKPKIKSYIHFLDNGTNMLGNLINSYITLLILKPGFVYLRSACVQYMLGVLFFIVKWQKNLEYIKVNCRDELNEDQPISTLCTYTFYKLEKVKYASKNKIK